MAFPIHTLTILIVGKQMSSPIQVYMFETNQIKTNQFLGGKANACLA